MESILAKSRAANASFRSTVEQRAKQFEFDVSGAAAARHRGRFRDFGQSTSGRSAAGHHYAEFRQWVYVAVHQIAKRVSNQPVNLGLPDGSPETRRAMHPIGAKVVSPTREHADYMRAVKDATASVRGRDVVRVLDHPILDLFECPNPVQGRTEFLYSTVASMLLTGVGYWLLGFNEEEAKPELWAVPSTWLTPVHDGKLFSGYILRTSAHAKPEPLPPEAVVRNYMPDPSDLSSQVPPPWTQQHAIDVDHKIQQSQNRAFDNGAFPQLGIRVGRKGGKDTPRRKLTDHQREELFYVVRQHCSGAANVGSPIILDNMIEDIFPINRAPREMDWEASGEIVKRRILQTYGLNPIAAGEITGSNRAQAAEAETSVCRCVNPLLSQFSTNATIRVARLMEGGENALVWLEPCQPRDEELEIRRWDVAGKLGAVDDDEIRQALVGLPPRSDDSPKRPKILDNPAALSAVVRLWQLVGEGTIGADDAREVMGAFGIGEAGADPPQRSAASVAFTGNKQPDVDAIRRDHAELVARAEEEVADVFGQFFRGAGGANSRRCG